MVNLERVGFMFSGRKYLFCPPSGNYQIVMKIPADLQPILNAKWIKRSLKTSNAKDAEIIYNGVLVSCAVSYI